MIDHTLLIEGGYVDHPADRGGPTKYGITQETLSQWRGYWVSKDEVKALDKTEAKDIYRDEYFMAPRIYMLPEPIKLFVFDCCINHGPSRAIKFVQKTCTKTGIAYLKIDGINGPRTLKAAKKACQEFGGYKFLIKLVGERINFYHAIVRRDPTQKVFLKGWLNRAESFL